MGCRVFVRRLDGLQGFLRQLDGLQPHCVTSGWAAGSLCDFWMGCRVFLRRLDGLQPHCVTSGWAAKLFEAAGWAAGSL